MRHTQQIPELGSHVHSASIGHTIGHTQEISSFSVPAEDEADEVFMQECWERTQEHKDDAKCEFCHWRFKCYTIRLDNPHHHHVTASGVTFSGAI